MVLGGIVPPLGLALLLLLPFLRRSWDQRALGGYGALAVGLGLALGVVFLLGGFDGVRRPVSVTQKLCWFGVAGALAGVVDGLLGSRRWPKILLRVGVPAGLLWWYLGFQREHHWTGKETALFIPAFAAGMGLLWTALEALATRRPGPSLALAWAASLGATGGALAVGGSSSLGQIAGALAAATGAAVIVTAWSRKLSISGLGAPIAFVLGGLVLGGHYAAELPTSSALLCLAGPLLPSLVELLSLNQSKPWLAGLLRLILGLTPPLLAAWLAY